MDEIWVHSRPISTEAIQNTASFTTLPVRINERNDVANAATRKALRDWNDSLHDGLAERELISFSELGNLGAFAYPEAPPERLAILTYLTDLGMLHDDGYEAMEMTAAVEEHRDFGRLFDPSKPAQLRPSTRASKLKKLVSQVLLEAIKIDRDMGMYMFDMYNKGWLAVAGKDAVTPFKSLEDYQAYRRDDFGLSAFWAMTEFGLNIRLSDEDKKLVQPVMEPIDRAIVWTNDYWSFDRESREARVNGSRINNVVEVVRQTRNMSADEAKAEVRCLLIGLEQEYVKRKNVFLVQHAFAAPYLKNWVEVVGAIVAGTHYWAGSAPRHHASRNSNGRESAGHEPVDTSLEVKATFGDGPRSPNGGTNDSSATDGHSSRSSTSSQSPLTDYSSAGNDGEPDPYSKRAEHQTESRNKRAATPSDESSNHKRRCTPDVLLHTVAHRETRIKGLEEERTSLVNHSQGGKDSTTKVTKSRQSWYKPPESALQAPIHYICSMPSKGVRFRLLEAFNYWLKADEPTLKRIGELVDLLHNASLILDDIEDGSPKCRGKPATHAIFGHSQAINSANFMFVQAVNATRKDFRSPFASEILLAELEHLYLGQSWDLYWKYNLQCPSLDEYLNMVDNKTGSMFRLLLRLVQAETDHQTSSSMPVLDQLTILFGRFFQIRDDYMNLCSSAYAEQKGAYEDLDEGKFSYPIVHCIAHHEGFRSFINGIFRQQRSSITTGLAPLAPEVKEFVVEYLRSSGTFDHCQRYLEQIEAELVAEIGRVEKATNEPNPVLRLLLEKLSVQ